MKNNENKEICSKCGGICCRNMPGQYVPADLFDHEMTKEELKKFILEVGNISIDCWNADEESDYKDYYYLRPMRRKLTLKESIDNRNKLEYPIVDNKENEYGTENAGVVSYNQTIIIPTGLVINSGKFLFRAFHVRNALRKRVHVPYML